MDEMRYRKPSVKTVLGITNQPPAEAASLAAALTKKDENHARCQ